MFLSINFWKTKKWIKSGNSIQCQWISKFQVQRDCVLCEMAELLLLLLYVSENIVDKFISRRFLHPINEWIWMCTYTTPSIYFLFVASNWRREKKSRKIMKILLDGKLEKRELVSFTICNYAKCKGLLIATFPRRKEHKNAEHKSQYRPLQ